MMLWYVFASVGGAVLFLDSLKPGSMDTWQGLDRPSLPSPAASGHRPPARCRSRLALVGPQCRDVHLFLQLAIEKG